MEIVVVIGVWMLSVVCVVEVVFLLKLMSMFVVFVCIRWRVVV